MVLVTGVCLCVSFNLTPRNAKLNLGLRYKCDDILYRRSSFL
jgi:hypothetical protein